MAEKTRFSARVKSDTLEAIDNHSEETGLNRSATIDQIVEEWEQAGNERTLSLVEVLAQRRLTVAGLGLLALAFLILAGSAFVFTGPVSTAVMFAATGVLAASTAISILNYAAYTALTAETLHTAGQPTRRSSDEPQEGVDT